MAGGVLKAFGILFIILGIVLMVAGLGAAAYGFTQEDANQEGVLDDPQESDQNQAIAAGGLVAAGLGLVLLLLGIILNAVGNGMRERALRRDLTAAVAVNRTTTQVVVRDDPAPRAAPRAGAMPQDDPVPALRPTGAILPPHPLDDWVPADHEAAPAPPKGPPRPRAPSAKAKPAKRAKAASKKL